MELRKINIDNIWKITKLKVLPEQEDFVATNVESILEAYAAIESGYTALPFGLYEGGEPVGFVMIGYDTVDGEEDPEIARGNYCLWRFMIDAKQQGRGYGKAGLNAALRYIRTKPCGPAEYIWLSYEPDNKRAKALYESFGFRENGEICGDEIVSVCRI